MLTQLLLLCLGMLSPPALAPSKCNALLLPSLCSAFSMHPYSIVQLPMGVDMQIALFFFFL